MQPQSTPAIDGLSLGPISTLTDTVLVLTLPVTQFCSLSHYQHLPSARHATGHSVPFWYQIILSCLIRYGLLYRSVLQQIFVFVSHHTFIISSVPLLQRATVLYVLFREIFFPSVCCPAKAPFDRHGCYVSKHYWRNELAVCHTWVTAWTIETTV